MSTIQDTHKLKQALFIEYGGFADKRIKNLDKASAFFIDERDKGGYAADGSLYGSWCGVLADVVDGHTVNVTLHNLVPFGPAISQWERANSPTKAGIGLNERMTFQVTRADLGKLTSLADALLSIVRPGARYPVAAYKYACPRAAAALRRLHGVLSAHPIF